MSEPVRILDTFVEPAIVEPGQNFKATLKLEHTQRFGNPVTLDVSFLETSTSTVISTNQVTVEPASQGTGFALAEFTHSIQQTGQTSFTFTVSKDIRGQEAVTVQVTVGESPVDAPQAGASVLEDDRDPVVVRTEQPNDELEVTFGKYVKPDVSIESAVKYAKHDVVGGPIVRQKTGEEPREMTISGACTGETAGKMHDLPKSSLFSVSTYQEDFDFAQLQTVSTRPMDTGGTVDLDGAQLYTYTMTFTEVTVRNG